MSAHGFLACRPPQHRRPCGFTLIEVLVVLAIVGIVVAGASLSLETLRHRDVDRAIERLRWVLEATAERAQTLGQPLALELLPDGYRFSALDTDGRWVAFDEAPLFSEQVLPDTLRWQGLRTAQGSSERVVFGNRSPRYELRVSTPDGIRVLAGQATGAVVLLPGAQAS